MSKFQVPESVEEAQERAEKLMDDIRTIEVTRSQRMVEVRAGVTLPPAEYKELLEWKSKANAAQAFKTIEYRKLKQWLKQNNSHMVAFNELRQRSGFNPKDPESILLFLINVMTTLIHEGVELRQDEQAVLDAAKEYFERK